MKTLCRNPWRRRRVVRNRNCGIRSSQFKLRDTRILCVFWVWTPSTNNVFVLRTACCVVCEAMFGSSGVQPGSCTKYTEIMKQYWNLKLDRGVLGRPGVCNMRSLNRNWFVLSGFHTVAGEFIRCRNWLSNRICWRMLRTINWPCPMVFVPYLLQQFFLYQKY